MSAAALWISRTVHPSPVDRPAALRLAAVGSKLRSAGSASNASSEKHLRDIALRRKFIPRDPDVLLGIASFL